MDALKKQVGLAAANLVESDMVLGLGTGSTVRFFIEEIARRVQEEALHITAVTTSRATSHLAESLGLAITAFDQIDRLDLTVDGADEVDADLNGIKGGGGALLMEKIVAINSTQVVWIVDESKYVPTLGAVPLPVEVVRFGADQLFRRFVDQDYFPDFRKNQDGSRYQTDQGNYIIDLHLDRIKKVRKLAEELKGIVGVVEHGLFLEIADQVLVADSSGIQRLVH